MLFPFVAYPTFPKPGAAAGPVTLGMEAVPMVPEKMPVAVLYVTDTVDVSLLPVELGAGPDDAGGPVPVGPVPDPHPSGGCPIPGPHVTPWPEQSCAKAIETSMASI